MAVVATMPTAHHVAYAIPKLILSNALEKTKKQME